MRFLRWLIVIVVFAGAAVGSALLVERLLSTDDVSDNWKPAIESAATITLVILTAAYVIVTRQLVTEQRREGRRQSERAALAEVSSLILVRFPAVVLMSAAVASIPDNDPPPSITFPFEQDVHLLGVRLMNLHGLLPADLQATARSLGDRLMSASGRLQRLEEILGIENEESSKPNESWSKERVTESYTTSQTLVDAPTYDDLVDQSFFLGVQADLTDFVSRVDLELAKM